MLTIYLPVVLITLYYAVYYYFTRNFNYWKKRNVVGPKPVALFGNLKEPTLRQKNIAVTVTEIYNMYPKEKVVGFYRMTTPALLIRDPDIIKSIMIKDFELFQDRGVNSSSKGLGHNLFSADGDLWSVLRSRFNPIFTPGKLKNMFPLFNERANVFMDRLHKMSTTDPEFEVHTLMQKYTVSTIFACAFGIDMDAFQDKENETLKWIDKVTLTPNYTTELDMMFPGILKKLNIALFPTRMTNFFYSLVANVISQRNGKPTNRGDLMDLILNLRQMGQVQGLRYLHGNENKSVEITDEIIAAQAFVFYVAGYETSATTMSYLMHELAQNLEVQDKLREEIDNVTKSYNGEITYESLGEMKYLDKCFSETLRKYPIVDPLQRKAKVDYKIPGTDVIIQKDHMVFVPVTGIHHDEQYYPKPEVFDPERFDPEVMRNRHPCAYLPFGVGPRNCIGMRFGALQSRLCMAKLLTNFRVEPNERTKTTLGIEPQRVIVGPKEVIRLNIIPRDR